MPRSRIPTGCNRGQNRCESSAEGEEGARSTGGVRSVPKRRAAPNRKKASERSVLRSDFSFHPGITVMPTHGTCAKNCTCILMALCKRCRCLTCGTTAALLWVPHPFVNSEEWNRKKDVDSSHSIVGPTGHISCKQRDLFQKEELNESGNFNWKGIRLIWGLVLTRRPVKSSVVLACFPSTVPSSSPLGRQDSPASACILL